MGKSLLFVIMVLMGSLAFAGGDSQATFISNPNKISLASHLPGSMGFTEPAEATPTLQINTVCPYGCPDGNANDSNLAGTGATAGNGNGKGGSR